MTKRALWKPPNPKSTRFGQVIVHQPVVAVLQVEQQVRHEDDLMIPQQIAECHDGRSRHAVEGVVAGVAVHDVRREIQLVLVHLQIAFLVDIVGNLRKARNGRIARDGFFQRISEHIVAEIDLNVAAVALCRVRRSQCGNRRRGGKSRVLHGNRILRLGRQRRAILRLEELRRLQLRHLEVTIERIPHQEDIKPGVVQRRKGQLRAIPGQAQLVDTAERIGHRLELQCFQIHIIDVVDAVPVGHDKHTLAVGRNDLRGLVAVRPIGDAAHRPGVHTDASRRRAVRTNSRA